MASTAYTARLQRQGVHPALPAMILLALSAILLPTFGPYPVHLLPVALAQQPAPTPLGTRYIPRLSPTVTNWTYRQSGKDYVTLPAPSPALDGRFWDERHLQESIWNLGLPQFKPFLDRLQRGDPVHVVALGCSVVQDHGGCYHPSKDHLLQLVQQPPMVYRIPDLCFGWPRFPNGFLFNFMDQLNRTWPHLEHTLVNAGRGGEALGYYLRNCGEDEVPQRVDLWILENMDGRTDPALVEGVIWSILRSAASRGQPRPAIVLLNSAAVAVADSVQCLGMPRLCDIPGSVCGPQADGTPKFRSTLWGADFRARHEGAPHAAGLIGQYYGVSVLSHTQFMVSFMRDGLHTARNWTECWFLAHMYRDAIHPNPIGRVLLADFLVNLLALAEQHAQAAPGEPGPPGLPPEPLYAASRDALVTRCYMVEDERYSVSGHSPYAYNTTRLQVLLNQGFQLVEYYNTSQGVLKYKPGFVATEAGARFSVAVDATFPADVAPANSTMLMVTYLKSWDRMGIARVNCGGECLCATVDIDAYHEHRISVQASVAMPLLRAGRACSVDLEVLTASSAPGGGHRFKLVNVVAAARPAAQARFGFPPWTGFSGAPAVT